MFSIYFYYLQSVICNLFESFRLFITDQTLQKLREKYFQELIEFPFANRASHLLIENNFGTVVAAADVYPIRMDKGRVFGLVQADDAHVFHLGQDLVARIGRFQLWHHLPPAHLRIGKRPLLLNLLQAGHHILGRKLPTRQIRGGLS